MNLANDASTEIIATGTMQFGADVFGERKNVSLSDVLQRFE